MNITSGTGDMAPDPDQQKSSSKNKLLTRIISALVMLPVAVFIILGGGTPYFILVALLTVLIISEWNGIVENKPLSPLVFVMAASALLLLSQINWQSPYLLVSLASSLIAIIAAAYLFKAKIIWALTGFIYAVVPSAAFLLINDNYGGLLVLWMMILIWSMDTGAYFAGKNIGGPKMSPKISPNKTWSGLIGGMITAIIFGGLFGHFMKGENVPLFEDATILLILSGLLSLLSQVGDLAESAVKRRFAIKDSGTIIPGHGGIMDRVDGVLFVAPAVFAIIFVLYG